MKLVFPQLPDPAVTAGDSVNGSSNFYSAEQVHEYLEDIERANPLGDDDDLWQILIQRSEQYISRIPGESEFDFIQRAIDYNARPQRPKPTEVLPLAGQTCIVRGGGAVKGYVGMVVDWEARFPYEHISVRHPVTGVVQNLAPHNVELLPPRS